MLVKHAEVIQDSTKAIELFENYYALRILPIKIDPMYANSYCNRGLAYEKIKKYSEAIADYKKAMELDPRLTYYLTNCLNCCLREQKEGAKEFLKGFFSNKK